GAGPGDLVPVIATISPGQDPADQAQEARQEEDEDDPGPGLARRGRGLGHDVTWRGGAANEAGAANRHGSADGKCRKTGRRGVRPPAPVVRTTDWRPRSIGIAREHLALVLRPESPDDLHRGGRLEEPDRAVAECDVAAAGVEAAQAVLARAVPVAVPG